LKKLVLSTILTVLFIQVALSSDYTKDMTWLRLIQKAESEEQIDILQTVFDPTDRIVEQFEADALEESLHGERYKDCDAELVEKFQTILIDRLGELNCKNSADANIYEIFASTTNSSLKRSSAIALAKMDSKEYKDDIIKLLNDANSKQYFLVTNGYRNSVLDNEKTAYAAVIALEYLRDESAYEVLFRAYNCGYSEESGIRDSALATMDYITENPIRLLKEISDKEYSSKIRAVILDMSQKSNALDVQKVDLATYLFTQTILNEYEFGDYMMEAATIIGSSPYKVPNTEKAIKKILNGAYEKEFSRVVITSALHCQNGVEVLSEYLKEQNILTKKGNTQYKNHGNILEVIKVLGDSGDRNAIEQLIVAKNVGWPKEITLAADTALNTLLTK